MLEVQEQSRDLQSLQAPELGRAKGEAEAEERGEAMRIQSGLQ